jgi:hypothetical protein
MVYLDKCLLWHPRRDNKFIVGGNSQITLYEWAAEYPEIRHITSQHDLHFMKVRLERFQISLSQCLLSVSHGLQTQLSRIY